MKKKKPLHYATLHFDLMTPEGRDEFTLANKAGAMFTALFDIYNQARNTLKHGGNERDALEAIRMMSGEFTDLVS